MCARSDLTFQTLCRKIFTKWHAICIEPHYSTMFLNHHGLHMALINDHIIALVAEPIHLEILILWGFRVNSRYNLDYEHRWNGNAASSWPLFSFLFSLFHSSRASSAEVSRTMRYTPAQGRGTALLTEPIATAASTAACRSVWRWAWAAMVSLILRKSAFPTGNAISLSPIKCSCSLSVNIRTSGLQRDIAMHESSFSFDLPHVV